MFSNNLAKPVFSIAAICVMTASMISCRGTSTKSEATAKSIPTEVNPQEVTQRLTEKLSQKLSKALEASINQEWSQVDVSPEGDRTLTGKDGAIICRSENACFLKFIHSPSSDAQLKHLANGAFEIKFKAVIEKVKIPGVDFSPDSLQKSMLDLLKIENSGAEMVNRISTPVVGRMSLTLCAKVNAELSGCDTTLDSLHVSASDLFVAGGEEPYAREYSFIYLSSARQ